MEAQRAQLLRAQRAALASFLEAYSRAQAKQKEMLSQLLREMLKERPAVIAEKLNDKQPLTRWAAAQVIAHRRLPFEEKLIGVLTDPVPEVQHAARAALVRLSRGNDFGPLPAASAKQLARSIRAWRWWHGQQDPLEPIPEFLPAPQIAEGEESPQPDHEPLPRPQLAEADDARP